MLFRAVCRISQDAARYDMQQRYQQHANASLFALDPRHVYARGHSGTL